MSSGQGTMSLFSSCKFLLSEALAPQAEPGTGTGNMNPETSMHRAIFIRGFHTLPFSALFFPLISPQLERHGSRSPGLCWGACHHPSPLIGTSRAADGAVGMQQQWSCKTLPSTGWTEAEATSHLPPHPPEMSLAFKCTSSLK